MALLLFATPALLVPPLRVPRRAERQPNVRMELRMPEDGSTVDALIERTKQTTASLSGELSLCYLNMP